MTHPHQLTTNVKLLQKAVLIHRGAALILRRAADSTSRPDKWDLPGGNSEWPTADRQGFGLHRQDIVREIREETTIQLDPNDFTLDHLVFFDTFFNSETQMYSIIGGWSQILPDDFDRSQVMISPEHTAARWIEPATLDDVDFGGNKGEFIKTMIRVALTRQPAQLAQPIQ